MNLLSPSIFCNIPMCKINLIAGNKYSTKIVTKFPKNEYSVMHLSPFKNFLQETAVLFKFGLDDECRIVNVID